MSPFSTRNGGLLGPSAILETIVTVYDNKTIGFQCNNYDGTPVRMEEVVRILRGVSQAIAHGEQERQKANQQKTNQQQSARVAAGLSLLPEPTKEDLSQ